jgi:hypothetical protein
MKNRGTPNRTVSIVFIERGEDNFDIVMEGISPERAKELQAIPKEDWSPAEFYASVGMSLVTTALAEAGAVRNIRKKTL